MIAGKTLDTDALPGSAANLLDACQRIEKAKNNTPKLFNTTEETFKIWLGAAGYRFKAGRPPKIEEEYWTKLCIKTIGNISCDVFR